MEISIVNFLRHQSLISIESPLLRAVVQPDFNPFKIVVIYLQIKKTEFKCQSCRVGENNANLVSVDLNGKWPSIGVVRACAHKKKNAELACVAKVLSVFGRPDLAMQAAVSLTDVPIFVNVPEPKNMTISKQDSPANNEGKRASQSLLYKKFIENLQRSNRQVSYENFNNIPGYINRNGNLSGTGASWVPCESYLETFSRSEENPQSRSQNIFYPQREPLASNKRSFRVSSGLNLNEEQGAKLIKCDNSVKEKTECAFLKFLNVRDSFAHLLHEVQSEPEVIEQQVKVEDSQVRSIDIEFVAAYDSSYERIDPSQVTSASQMKQNLNSLPNVETVEVFTNFDELNNLHVVKLSVNSLYTFFGRAWNLEDALESAKLEAIKFFSQPQGTEYTLIPSSTSKDPAMLLQLIEGPTGIPPQQLSITFDFIFEKRSWKSILRIKDSVTHSGIFSSKKDSINDVLLKYLTNTHRVKCF